MVNVTVNLPWPFVLLGFCVVVGVPMWIGYLLGRVRTLDPHGHRLDSSGSSGSGLMVFGLALLFLGGVVLAPMILGGPPRDFDGEGFLVLVCGLLLFGFGALYIRRGIQASRTLRQ